MKTSYSEIVSTKKQHDLLIAANQEMLTPAHTDAHNTLLILIDFQQDFMPNGALGVPGADQDVMRVTKWIYDNIAKLTTIAVSIDTHNPFQIFHPCWWENEKSENPPPFTAISLADLDSGKWRPVILPNHSREYVEALSKSNKKVLVIWPYHCLQGTQGCALDPQISNMVYFHSVARKSMAIRIVKGTDPGTEMYGIIKPEWDPKNFVNIQFLNKLEQYQQIVIAGEAKSHCVLESILQMLEHYKQRPEITKRVFILEDAMSIIPGFEGITDAAFKDFKSKYQVNLTTTKDFAL
jgi:nicotinamidase-related amidase